MIKATFDGQEREFNIDREYISFLEKSMARSLYATLQVFIAGQWTFDDVATVVSFALHGPRKEDRATVALSRQMAKHGLPMTPSAYYRPHPDVVSVLERDGHGNYAPLASDILSDAVFGPVEEGAPVEIADAE